MALNIKVRNKKGRVRLALKGRFDFHSNADFRRVYEEELQGDGSQGIEVDFRGVDYMDSSALGMLLLLKSRAGDVNREISLVNCTGTIRQILDVVNFGKMFAIT